MNLQRNRRDNFLVGFVNYLQFSKIYLSFLIQRTTFFTIFVGNYGVL